MRATIRLAICTGLVSLCSFIPAAQAIPFSEISQVIFFGDSLTDSGFNNTFNAIFSPSTPATKAPTFTTYAGYTWAQYVAQDITGVAPPPVGTVFPTSNDNMTNNTTPIFSYPGEPFPPPEPNPLLNHFNYACGGARTAAEPGVNFFWAPNVNAQIQNYLSTAPQVLDPKALYFIWAGANDMLFGISSQLSPPAFLQLIDTTTTQIALQVKTLARRGAKRIVVLSLPNIGVTPFVEELAQQIGDPTLPATMKNLSFIFNSLLNQKLGALNAFKKRRGIKILYFDTYAALDGLIKNALAGVPTVVSGQSFYFNNVTDPVCTSLTAISCTQTSNYHLFADSVHPTDEAHRALSLEVENQIKLWK
jgi:outer membrane lipase/esterase